jgi:ketosteroid isomerase-like protein
MDSNQLLEIVNRFFDAYNNVDIEYIDSIISDKIHWEHHNKFKGDGKPQAIQSIHNFSEKAPGRYFEKPTRWAVHGQTIFIEHKWHAVPALDVALFGWKEGVPVTMEIVTLFVFEDGKLVEWSDYA